MSNKHVYEYSVIRFVPKVEREEFLNVGVIVYCKRRKFLEVRYHLDVDRILGFAPEAELEKLASYLNTWDLICQGKPAGGPIAQLDLASRFRWLTAVRSTIIQSSPIHPGLCTDPEAVLDKLFKKYVT